MAAGTTTRALQWFPSGASGVTLTAGGSAWTFGSWVEIAASVGGSDAALRWFIVGDPSGAAQLDFQIQFGTGGAGSETPQWTFPFGRHGTLSTAEGSVFAIPIPVSVPSGTRLAARLACSTASVTLTGVAVGYNAAPDVYTTNAPVVSHPALSSATITPSGTIYVYGSWVELIASTSTDIQVWGVGGRAALNTYCQVQIGTGSAGSETPLWTLEGRSSGNFWNLTTPHSPIQEIPAGTRVAARLSINTTSTASWTIMLGVYNDANSGQTIEGATIASGAALFAPVLAYVVALPAIASAAALFAPLITATNDIFFPALGPLAQLYPPTIFKASRDQAVACERRDARQAVVWDCTRPGLA